MSLFICGNSHTRALRRGASLLEPSVAEQITVFPLGTADNETVAFSTIEDGKVVLTNPRFRNKLQQYFGFSAFEPEHQWGICLASHVATFGKPGWENSAPSWMNLEDRVPVSEALFERIVFEDQKNVRLFFTQLLETGVKPFAISSPWPVRWHPIITKYNVPFDVVKSVDTRARVLYARWLAEHGIPIVTPPVETADEEGFLLKRFCKSEDDIYHANGRYGRLMMEKVMREQGHAALATSA